jgi:transcription initiation factor TFIID TATA-box-binding protein
MADLDLEIANVVGWISYRQELDLAALADTFADRSEITSVTYEPAENHWLQTNFAPDDTYVAFYRSGRCSITGIDSVEQFEDTVGRVNAVMKDLLEFDFTPESKVSNIVATTTLNSEVDLEALALQLGLERVEYEPEQFPALIYRDSDSNAVILVFSSGKLLCTGLTDLDKIDNTVERFAEKITIGT